jgi:hypothetical protein
VLRRTVIAIGLVAALLAGAAITSATAASRSKSKTRAFSGTFTFHLAPPPCAALFCVRGVFHGGPFVSGSWDESVTTNTALGPDRPGVFYGEGKFIIHTRLGDLPCAESYVFDLSPAGDKQGGVICKFESGTRQMKGASGHLELYGSQPAGTAPGSVGAGRYGGKLTLP